MKSKRWQILASAPTAAAVITSAFSLLAQVLILRTLTETNSGMFVLFQAASQLIMIVSSLGQPTQIQRVYSKAKPGTFNWSLDLTRSFIVSGPVLILGTLLVYFIYRFSPLVTILIFLQSVLLLAILLMTRILNAFQSYTLSSGLIRLPNSLLVLPALLFTFFPSTDSLDKLLIYQVSLTLVTFLGGLIALKHTQAIGSTTIPLGDRFRSVIFLATQFTYQGPELALTALAGILLPASRIAVYQAAVIFLRPFALLGDVLRTIFTTELIRRPNINRRRVNLALWGLGGLVGLLTWFPGNLVFRWIYADKYLDGAALLPWIALAGTLILPEILPRSVLIGQASFKLIMRYALTQAILALSILVSAVFSIQAFEVQAIAISVVIINLGRYLVSRYFSHNIIGR